MICSEPDIVPVGAVSLVPPTICPPGFTVPSTTFLTTCPPAFNKSIDDVVILMLPILICSSSAFISVSTAPSLTNLIDSDVIYKSLNGLSNEPKS